MRRTEFVLFLSLLLASCQSPPKEPLLTPPVAGNTQEKNAAPVAEKIDDLARLAAPPLPEAPAANVQVQLVASLQTDPQPNSYRVQLHAEAARGNPTPFFLLRHEIDESAAPGKNINGLAPDWNDRTVEPGKNYRYDLWKTQGAEAVPVATVQIEIPRDLTIDREEVFSEIRGYQRLFLLPGGSLTTYGDSLTIAVDEIIATGGVIQTFPTERAAAESRDGADGGTLRIFSRTGSGVLRIHGVGEAGGQGKKGNDGITGKAGVPGTDGRVAPWEAPKSDYYANLANYRGSYVKRATELKLQCVAPPGDGTPGEPGTPGKNGQPGSQGGRGARVEITVDNAASLKIDAQVTGGRGGRGGLGGLASAESAGGAPGKQDPDKVCPPAHPGPNGPAGMQGQAGHEGSPGPLGSVCLRLNKVVSGDCGEEGEKQEPLVRAAF